MPVGSFPCLPSLARSPLLSCSTVVYLLLLGLLPCCTPSSLSDGRTAGTLANTVSKDPSRFWPRGIIPYKMDPQLVELYRDASENVSIVARIHKAIAHWEDRTCIRFRDCGDSCTIPYLKFVTHGGCSSFVGIAYSGENLVKLAGYCTFGTIVHELGHTIGLGHEHSRRDRDNYIAIDDYQVGSRTHYFTKQLVGRDVGPYDYDSIMHYGEYDFTTKGGRTIISPKPIGQRVGLSAGDIESIGFLYNNCAAVYAAPTCLPNVRTPPGQPRAYIYTDGFRGTVVDPLGKGSAYMAAYSFNGSVHLEFNVQYSSDVQVAFLFEGGVEGRVNTSVASGDSVPHAGYVAVDFEADAALDAGREFSLSVTYSDPLDAGKAVTCGVAFAVNPRLETPLPDTPAPRTAAPDTPVPQTDAPQPASSPRPAASEAPGSTAAPQTARPLPPPVVEVRSTPAPTDSPEGSPVLSPQFWLLSAALLSFGVVLL